MSQNDKRTYADHYNEFAKKYPDMVPPTVTVTNHTGPSTSNCIWVSPGYPSQPAVQYGWACPRCSVIHAPTVVACYCQQTVNVPFVQPYQPVTVTDPCQPTIIDSGTSSFPRWNGYGWSQGPTQFGTYVNDKGTQETTTATGAGPEAGPTTSRQTIPIGQKTQAQK